MIEVEDRTERPGEPDPERDRPLELWCEGLRLAGMRRITAEERRLLGERLAAGRRRARLVRGGFLLVGVGLLGAVAVAAMGAGSLEDLGSRLFAAVGVVLLVVGGVGALAAALLSQRPWLRTVLAASLIAAVLGWVLGGVNQSEAWRDIVSIGAIVTFLAGNATALIEWTRQRRLRPALARSDADLDRGEVLEFRVPEGVVGGPLAGLDVLAGGKRHDQPHSPETGRTLLHGTETRGRSASANHHVVVRVGGEIAPALVTCRTVEVAPTPAEEPDDGDAVDRRLSGQEVRELSRLRARAGRRVRTSLPVAVGFGILALAQLLTGGGDGDALSFAVWAAGAVILFGRSAWLWRWHFRLGRDLKRRRVAYAFDAEGASTRPAAEILPSSRTEWTQHSIPSPWRTRFW